MDPGLYPNMTRDEYDDELCLNQSTIKVAHEKSMMHAYNKLLDTSSATPAMIIGKALHHYMFERDTFSEHFAKMPVTKSGAKVSRATAKGKLIWDEWTAHHADKYALKQADLNAIIAMRESVMRNHEARELIENASCVETSFFWQHPEYGFDCKGQLDLLSQLHGWTCIVDLKSTIDASPDGFEKDIAKYSYMIQHAWYLEGLGEIATAEREFRFIAVEKSHPYPCAVYALDPLNVYEGKYRCDLISKRWDRALDTQEWLGYPGGTIIARAKKWAMSHERAEYEDDGSEDD